jgi:DNA-binding SARP family transcriptional activator
MGRELAPAMIALSIWGDQWTTPDGATSTYEHEECGGNLALFIRCDGCGEVPELDEIGAESRAPNDASPLRQVLPEAGEVVRLTGPALIEISLMGTFSVRIGQKPIATPSVGTQRILAYLALHDKAVTRLSMAGTMWPEVSDFNAGGSLRSALTRVEGPTREAITMASGGLRLATDVVVDFRQAQALAHRLLLGDGAVDEDDFAPAAVAALSADLLPDWYDDWVMAEAEDWRQLRTSGLEVQAEWLTAAGRFAEAAGAARAAMRAEPLRESAHACLIRVHIAEGNESEALRAFDNFSSILESELGLTPTDRLTALLAKINRV